MNAIKKEEKIYTYQEYLEFEMGSQEKHDYFFGEVYNMSGGTIRHHVLAGNVYTSLKQSLIKKDCLIIYEFKVELRANDFYVYPDIVVSCDKGDKANDLDSIIRNPSIIVEVLSDSTELYDRNIKKHYYLKLPSLKYYLLVSQNETKVEMFEKIENRIEYSFYEKPEDVIEFRQLDFKMKVSDIYAE